MRASLKRLMSKARERECVAETLMRNEDFIQANGPGAYTLCMLCASLNLMEAYCPKHGRILVGDKCPVCGGSARYKPSLTCANCGSENLRQVVIKKDDLRIYTYFLRVALRNNEQIGEAWLDNTLETHENNMRKATLAHGKPLARWVQKREKLIMRLEDVIPEVAEYEGQAW